MKRIGLISPSMNKEKIENIYNILPRDIRIEARAMGVTRVVDREFEKAEEAFAEIVKELTHQPLDFLMITGELFFAYKGPGSDRLILDRVKQITPVPASTVLTAVINACRHLKMRRVALASPFRDDQSLRLIKFLAHDGIEVATHRSLGYEGLKDVWNLPPETGYEAASALLQSRPDVDGVYMPCNNWRITTVIDRIEKDFNIPVVTNTQAWVWKALQAMKIKTPITGFGQLFREIG